VPATRRNFARTWFWAENQIEENLILASPASEHLSQPFYCIKQAENSLHKATHPPIETKPEMGGVFGLLTAN
jgi:hypothetical protein